MLKLKVSIIIYESTVSSDNDFAMKCMYVNYNNFDKSITAHIYSLLPKYTLSFLLLSAMHLQAAALTYSLIIWVQKLHTTYSIAQVHNLQNCPSIKLTVLPKYIQNLQYCPSIERTVLPKYIQNLQYCPCKYIQNLQYCPSIERTVLPKYIQNLQYCPSIYRTYSIAQVYIELTVLPKYIQNLQYSISISESVFMIKKILNNDRPEAHWTNTFTK